MAKNIGKFPAPVVGENEEVMQWDNLARKIADQYWHKYKIYPCHNAYDLDNVYSDALIGLLKGIRSYDEKKGVQKSTFYSLCILNQLHNAFRHHGKFNKGADTLFYYDTTVMAEEMDMPDEVDEERDMLEYLNLEFSEAEINSLLWPHNIFSGKYKGMDYKATKERATSKINEMIKSF